MIKLNHILLVFLVTSLIWNPDLHVSTNSAAAQLAPQIVSTTSTENSTDSLLSDGTHLATFHMDRYVKAANGTYVPYDITQNSTYYFINNGAQPWSIDKTTCIVSYYDSSQSLLNH